MEAAVALLFASNAALWFYAFAVGGRVETLYKVVRDYTDSNNKSLIRIWDFLTRLTDAMKRR